jgi:hypothetical protein
VGAEKRRHAARLLNRPERGELGVAVEAVARLGLERRRARARHPAAVPPHRLSQTVFPGRSCGADRGEDPTAARVQLLVGRTRGSKRKLLDAVAREARVRVAIDETGNRAATASVDHVDLRVRDLELAHAADGLDPSLRAEHVRVLDHLDVRQPTQRRLVSCARRRELLEVANQEPALAGDLVRHSPLGGAGSSSPWASAASSASG